MRARDIPDINAIIDPLIGTPYDEMQCRRFAAHLFTQGFGIDFDAPGTDLNQLFQEVWYQHEDCDPLRLLQPWDLLLMAGKTAVRVGSHVGVVVDSQYLVHAHDRKRGVTKVYLRHCRPHLIQVNRYRELL